VPPKKPNPKKQKPGRLVTDSERTRVRELHEQGLSRNAIAKEIGRPWSTVTKIAKELGLAFDREATRKAVAARVIDAKARRAELSALLLDDAHRLRERLWEESKQIASSPLGPEVITLELPPARDTKDFMAAVSGAVRSHAELEKLDTDSGAEAAKGMLGALAEGLQAAADHISGTSSKPTHA
jgi:hypothetical protein